MCGRYTLASDIEGYLRLFELEVPHDLLHPRRYNVAPSQPVLGIVADPHPRVEVLEWGFIPMWAKLEAKPRPVINARSETVADKPYFRGAFRSSRCLLLADGFYEWKKSANGKRPYRVTLRDGGVFSLAGLWSNVHDAHGSHHVTCAIVTVPANELMKSIHDRMPLILSESEAMLWLDPKARSTELESLLAPPPAERFTAYEVSTLVNSPAHDEPGCVDPWVASE